MNINETLIKIGNHILSKAKEYAAPKEHSHATISAGGMTLYPEAGNELNFGGTDTNTTIYIGYRPKDSRPKPVRYVLGGGDSVASIEGDHGKFRTFAIEGTNNPWIRLDSAKPGQTSLYIQQVGDGQLWVGSNETPVKINKNSDITAGDLYVNKTQPWIKMIDASNKSAFVVQNRDNTLQLGIHNDPQKRLKIDSNGNITTPHGIDKIADYGGASWNGYLKIGYGGAAVAPSGALACAVYTQNSAGERCIKDMTPADMKTYLGFSSGSSSPSGGNVGDIYIQY